ncbi:MAG TPA: hypothetical protein VKQ08_00285 [Cyclobacteriaceae bacterium]|nr:hypothetical protein [Cyclobacteriaceae bacterium]
MKKSVGRPKVPKTRAKAPGISVRLTQDERKLIDRAIESSGLSRSQWARSALLWAADGGKSDA